MMAFSPCSILSFIKVVVEMFLNIMDHVSAIVPEWAANILPRDLLFLLLWTASALPGIRLAVLVFPPAGRSFGLPRYFSPVD